MSKVGTLNFGGNTRSGTKLIVLASTKPYTSDPSMAFSRSSMSSSSVEPHYSQIVPMILSLTSLVPSDRQDLELLLVQPYSTLNFVPLHLPVSGEAHSHMRIPRFVALVGLVSHRHSKHIRE